MKMTNNEGPPITQSDQHHNINTTELPDLIRDRYSRARGGKSELLSISCANCNTPVLMYQKDGPGSLLRCYLDRSYLPENLEHPIDTKSIKKKSDIKPLTCSSCHKTLGTPMVYKRENRFAFRLIPGTISKKKIK